MSLWMKWLIGGEGAAVCNTETESEINEKCFVLGLIIR